MLFRSIYIPSNFDPSFNKLTLAQMLEGVRAAKEIYGRVGVQINLVTVKTGAIDPRFLAIQANEIPRVPDTEYINMYEGNTGHPSEPTAMALQAFQSLIEPRKDSDRTIYLVALQDVVMPFLDRSDARNWTVKMVRTGGLSFPSYSYWNTIPRQYRGVITLDNLSTPSRARRTVAHEIGHKVMNVSHEYKETSPAHEIFADGGLMSFPNIVINNAPMGYADVGAALEASMTSWKDFAWIREAWGGPIVAKGVHTADDARQAVDHGASAIVISNHGARQLDTVAPTVRLLPEVLDAVNGRIEVLLDSGVRRGSDIVKALAMGAKAVLIGRAYAYGLGAGGREGVQKAASILKADVVRTMKLLGCDDIKHLDGSFVDVPSDWTARLPR